MTSKPPNEKGFIALMSVLIISLVLFVAVISLAQYGLMTRYSLLDLERKAASRQLAEACMHIARIYAVNDPSRTESNLVLDVDGKSCMIDSLSPSGGTSNIVTCANEDGAITNLSTSIDNVNGDFESMTELATLLNGCG
jgi:hypothetical protein